MRRLTKAGNWAKHTRDTARPHFRLSHMLSSQPCHLSARPGYGGTAHIRCSKHQATIISRQPYESPSSTPVLSFVADASYESTPHLASSPRWKAALRHTPYDSPANYDRHLTGHDWLGQAYPFPLQRGSVKRVWLGRAQPLSIAARHLGLDFISDLCAARFSCCSYLGRAVVIWWTARLLVFSRQCFVAWPCGCLLYRNRAEILMNFRGLVVVTLSPAGCYLQS